MRMAKWTTFLFIPIFLLSFLTTSVYSSDKDRKTLNEFLNELEQKVKEVDKRMIAHPKFIEELLALIKKYRSRLRLVFLYDDFSDGNIEIIQPG